MAVENVSAERGFAFIEKFNTALTTKEERTHTHTYARTHARTHTVTAEKLF